MDLQGNQPFVQPVCICAPSGECSAISIWWLDFSVLWQAEWSQWLAWAAVKGWTGALSGRDGMLGPWAKAKYSHAVGVGLMGTSAKMGEEKRELNWWLILPTQVRACHLLFFPILQNDHLSPMKSHYLKIATSITTFVEYLLLYVPGTVIGVLHLWAQLILHRYLSLFGGWRAEASDRVVGRRSARVWIQVYCVLALVVLSLLLLHEYSFKKFKVFSINRCLPKSVFLSSSGAHQ